MASQTKNSFQFPSVPDSIVNPEERAIYLAQNYWENASPLDIYEPAVIESFFYVVSKIPKEKEKQCLKELLDSSYYNKDRFSTISFYIDFFIGSPDSEYWDDDIYLFTQRCIIESNLEESYKVAPLWRINLLSKNSIGSIATDILLTDINGQKLSLSELKMPCVVIFANSDCEQCKEELSLYSSVIEKVKELNWNVAIIYINGEIPDYVKAINCTTYINAEEKFEDDDLYVVRWLPSVYVFDKNFKVIAKEVKIKNLLQTISEIAQ